MLKALFWMRCFKGNSLGISVGRFVGIIFSSEKYSCLSCGFVCASEKGLNLDYVKYACLILYGVILHLDGYATRFQWCNVMQCNVMMITICKISMYDRDFVMYGLCRAECFLSKGIKVENLKYQWQLGLSGFWVIEEVSF